MKNLATENRIIMSLVTGAALVVLAAASALAANGQAVREIDDPPTGNHWLLMSDPGHPGGPGRMVLAAGLGREPAGVIAPARNRSQPRPVIRAGDRLIVEENTAVAEARLEAVALGSAGSGSPLPVRLKVGGKVVRAVALTPGRAALAPEIGARP
jgi:hypothetical protein